MTKGTAYYVRQAWRNPDAKVMRDRMTEWRKSEAIARVDKPLRIDKARALGYKAKKGIIVLRVRLKRGGHKRPRVNKGRRGKRLTVRKTLHMNYKWIAEQRAEKNYTNLVALNSYPIGKDGIFAFFEVIMVDPESPEIKSDNNLKWICNPANRKRAIRGKTSAARKSRGLRDKSPMNKSRPSRRAGNRLGN